VILGGDIGGTKSNLGLFELVAGVPRLVCAATFHSADFPDLAPMIARFLGAGGGATGAAIQAACFGVPGPVIDNRTHASNLAWTLDGGVIAAAAGLPSVLLINDLVATAEGIPLLRAEELAVLQPGDPEAKGNLALIAAGTGLGMALLPQAEGRSIAVPSEGGHSDFAPHDEAEIGLFRHLQRRFGGHVSVERVVSGPGLHHVYEYLRDSGFAPEEPRVSAAFAHDDPSRVIAEEALAHPGRGLCARALDLFAAAYGAAAGNLALLGTATGGVYLGGGIAPKVLPKLADGTFLRAFLDKGRFRSYLAAVPVRVILNDKTAMVGAARVAAR
jgi:glucokinase